MIRLRLTFLLAAALTSTLLAQEPAAPRVAKESKDPKVIRVKADLQAISSALQTYRINAGQFPTQAQGLEALVEKPTKEPVPKRWIRVMKAPPKDPWGNPYVLATRKNEKEEGKVEHFIFSNGPDAKDVKDDIEVVLPEIEIEVEHGHDLE